MLIDGFYGWTPVPLIKPSITVCHRCEFLQHFKCQPCNHFPYSHEVPDLPAVAFLLLSNKVVNSNKGNVSGCWEVLAGKGSNWSTMMSNPTDGIPSGVQLLCKIQLSRDRKSNQNNSALEVVSSPIFDVILTDDAKEQWPLNYEITH